MPKALIIDENKLLKWSLTEVLEKEKITVFAVDRCPDALEMMERHDFRMIFVNIDLKKTETLEDLRKLRRLQPCSRMVIMTTVPREEIQAQMDGIDVLEILEKPFELSKIHAVVRKAAELL